MHTDGMGWWNWTRVLLLCGMVGDGIMVLLEGRWWGWACGEGKIWCAFYSISETVVYTTDHLVSHLQHLNPIGWFFLVYSSSVLVLQTKRKHERFLRFYRGHAHHGASLVVTVSCSRIPDLVYYHHHEIIQEKG